MQATLSIILEAVIFNYHATTVDIINDQRLNQPHYGQNLLTTYANARSLLVYFTLFIIAQLFTVILVVDAVGYIYSESTPYQRLTLPIHRLIDMAEKHHRTHRISSV